MSCKRSFLGLIAGTGDGRQLVRLETWRHQEHVPVATSIAAMAMKLPLPSTKCSAAASPGCFTASNDAGVPGGPSQTVNS
jgi:hypothetical protein